MDKFWITIDTTHDKFVMPNLYSSDYLIYELSRDNYSSAVGMATSFEELQDFIELQDMFHENKTNLLFCKAVLIEGQISAIITNMFNGGTINVKLKIEEIFIVHSAHVSKLFGE